MHETIVLEGQIAIQAVLESRSRPIYTIYIQKNRQRQLAQLRFMAQAQNIPLSIVDQETISALAHGQTHGGIIAIVGKRRYLPLDQLASDVPLPFIAMLDGIEDPYNFAQAIRALYAAGAHGLVVRSRNWLNAGGIVARSSAGTSERMTIAQLDDPLEAVAYFKQRDLCIVCTANQSGALPLQKANLTQGLFIVIGGEKRGISKSILKHADVLVRIPYARHFAYSLGATAATSIIAYEIARQRGLSSVE